MRAPPADVYAFRKRRNAIGAIGTGVATTVFVSTGRASRQAGEMLKAS